MTSRRRRRSPPVASVGPHRTAIASRTTRTCVAFVAYARDEHTLRLGTMSHKHENLLRAIFHDPISGNIHWREIESLLHHLGASIESLSGARMRVKLHGYEGILHRPHRGNTLGRGDIQHLRDYLSHARATPSQVEAARER